MSLQNLELKEYYKCGERPRQIQRNKKRKITYMNLKKLRIFFLLSLFLSFPYSDLDICKQIKGIQHIVMVTIDKCQLEIIPTVDNHQEFGLITKGTG
jgi:hypothetical protein